MTRRTLALLFMLLTSSTLLAGAPLNVVTTIKPLHSILSNLLQNTQPPTLLIADRQLPYHYPLSTEQEESIQQADLLVWVGPELEKFMLEPLQKLSRQTTVLTLLDNEEIKVLPSRWEGQGRDPFFWLDSRNVIILADELARVLMRLDPERRALYEKNRHQLLTRLAELDRQLEYGYRGLKSGIGMAYYDTLQYFEQAYALKIRGVVTQSPTMPVSGESLLVNRAKLATGDYSCLLTEQQSVMEQLALLTNQITLNITPLDSFGSQLQPGADLYFELMKQNTDAIKQCLQYEHTPHALIEPEDEAMIPSGIGGRFMLQDHFGRFITDQDIAGKFQLIYFGYTFCPDVCPTSLIALSAALNQLDEAEAEQFQPLFITVDPERDTPKVLGEYVTYFHPSLIGLTGTKEMIEHVSQLYKVKFERVEDPSRPADQYIIDHSSGLYLMAPDGQFITKFAHGASPGLIAERLRSYLRK